MLNLCFTLRVHTRRAYATFCREILFVRVSKIYKFCRLASSCVTFIGRRITSAPSSSFGIAQREADVELIESRRRWNVAARARRGNGGRHFDLVLIKQRTSRVLARMRSAKEREEREGGGETSGEERNREGRAVVGRVGSGGWQVEAGWLRATTERLTRLKNVAWSIKGVRNARGTRNPSVAAAALAKGRKDYPALGQCRSKTPVQRSPRIKVQYV